MKIDRRSLLKTTVAAGVFAPAVLRVTTVHGAEITLKYANNSPVTHPLTIRTKEAMEAIAK